MSFIQLKYCKAVAVFSDMITNTIVYMNTDYYE